MFEENEFKSEKQRTLLKSQLFRYLSFWPFFLIVLFFLVSVSFIFLRYTDYYFLATSKIEIIDKAQDSEMALPTAMTVFNRSMINLENEIGVLSSFSIHSRVVSNLKSNILLQTIGNIKSSTNHPDDWFENYELDFKINPENISQHESFIIDVNNNLTIKHMRNGNVINSYDFNSYSTKNISHDLPFELQIFDIDQVNQLNKKQITFKPFESVVKSYIAKVMISKSSRDSDQLILSLEHTNQRIAIDYLNNLMSEFDSDGVKDRQLEYKRTMDFVDSRSVFLESELEQVEKAKQQFKERNNFSNIETTSNFNLDQRITYDTEIFNVRNQIELLSLLQSINEGEDDFSSFPVNIGVNDNIINNLINEYNLLIKNRNRFLQSAGPNNTLIKNLDIEINKSKENIINSIISTKQSLNLSLQNLESKENEYLSAFNSVPENEKILRSIQREIEVKEALFLLLLQKREEAAINFAVVKPSIKIIDQARGPSKPISPRNSYVYATAIILGILIPYSIITIWFLLDTKIHTRDSLKAILGDHIPILGEIPFHSEVIDQEFLKNNDDSRNTVKESTRMIISNMQFTNIDQKNNKCFLVTSSIKGEGKTIMSVTMSKLLSDKLKKVILLGADLRNPQIHKYTEFDKSKKGLSDYIYNKGSDYKSYLINYDNLDIFLSGTIPPNPTELLSSEKFKNLILQLKKDYDYVVIDSAPCLLVADTFEIASVADKTIYVVRANHTEIKVGDFIKENFELNKFNNLNIVFNGVGNSGSYGYRYGYQYGYRYGYKYGYNYGYGYGYNEDKKKT